MKLKDKVVVVTGASGGIGREIALALAREGARVAFAARSLATLSSLVGQAEAAGGTAMAVPLDVTDEASVHAAVAQVLARYGRIDVLVNNAGSGGTLGLWAAAEPAALRNMFDVHVFGAERMARAVLPAMTAQSAGTVVNIASTVAWVPMPGASAYSAAKAAVVALSESLCAELRGSGIDVRVFTPPHTSTASGKLWLLDLPKIFEPAWVAQQFVRALQSDRRHAMPGGNAMLLLVQRVWPALATRIMNGLGFRALARQQRTA
jgi:NAD(P)-dependent dehydrogenase (short-subunit alcohol dehydrogenase family)